MTKNEKSHFDKAKAYLERYTGSKYNQYRPYILLTNFSDVLSVFQKTYHCQTASGSVMSVAHSKTNPITMINFSMGAPTAALLIDLLVAVRPQGVMMLGWCGGLAPHLNIGDWVLPVAAIRDEGTSKHYMPERVPALPSFRIQTSIANALVKRRATYKTGIIHSTDYRFWELNQSFIQSLKEEKSLAIEMECSSLFIAGLKRKIPVGALLMVSDLPLVDKKEKTRSRQKQLFKKWGKKHIEYAIEALYGFRSNHVIKKTDQSNWLHHETK